MCRWAGVSKSGYYAWRDGPDSSTMLRRKELAVMVKDVFESSHGTYGYRRVAAALARQKLAVTPSTVRSVMRELGLVAAQPRAKVRTTVPAQDLDERPDLVRRDPAAPDPGLK